MSDMSSRGPGPIDPEIWRKAQRAVATRSTNAEDCRTLLQMLGIQGPPEFSGAHYPPGLPG
ncbi:MULTISPECIES: hypothetical protein [Hoyosella]|uniref:Uncharacterized protein n=2 Tax=Hoyosella TaxID=697025 RepID=F6EHJ3_HOYSD|nr:MULTISPECIES: hypothetical protein [Hoyosella]AEF42357.1 hypothetical protein AS9A_3921 [Hoyosella subflava DQS3-9A1]MBB3039781.1 hypothetical protein [Hoyosella altamirensis]